MADFLRRLVDAGELSGMALGLARLVIAGGEEALTGRQRFLFQRLVLDP